MYTHVLTVRVTEATAKAVLAAATARKRGPSTYLREFIEQGHPTKKGTRR